MTFSFPRVPDIELEDQCREFLRLLMVAVHDSMGPEAVQFVILFKVEEIEGRVSYTITSPHRQPILWLGNHIEAHDFSSEAVRGVGDSVLAAGLEWHVALPFGLTVPIVVDPKPPGSASGYYNLNQVRDPGQFVNPYLCDTTSGFLNFIGAVLVDAGNEPRKTILWENLESLYEKGLEEWFRWFYCFIDSAIIFDPDRLYVADDSPESWLYDYRGDERNSGGA